MLEGISPGICGLILSLEEKLGQISAKFGRLWVDAFRPKMLMSIGILGYGTRGSMLAGALAFAAVCLLPAGQGTARADSKYYDVAYQFRLLPDEGSAKVTIGLDKNADYVRQIRLHIDPERHTDFEGDGEVSRKGNYVYWDPPKGGGELEYMVDVNNTRKSGSYDSRMTEDWALFRGDDLVPPVSVRTKVGAESRARLRFKVPKDWATVTPYKRRSDSSYVVESANRRFDRPVGWMLTGSVGLRLEEISGTKVVVAGPFHEGVRRQDVLAFLNWNLPELLQVFPDYYEKLLIVSAGDPMWRGGLSGPGSLFIHSDRPLISENGTSSLLHEIVHTAMRIRAKSDDDWIVEGFAEYYSLEAMRRSGTISPQRYDRALKMLTDWSADVKDLKGARSHGPKTARAVLVLRDLDGEIRELSGGEASLDDVARQLAREGGKVTLEGLRKITEEIVGREVESLKAANLPLAGQENDLLSEARE